MPVTITNRGKPTAHMEALLVGSRGKELERDIQLAGMSTAPVLITGEPGVGKDVVARLVHDRSARCAAPFVTVSCNGLTDSQLRRRLFGAKPGAHRGSEGRGTGAFQQAQGGTLHLDAVADIGLAVQWQLLRLLQTKELQPTMSTPRLDARIIATTSRPLFERVLDGGFLEGLYYQLNIIHLVIPPLRERRDDIPAVIAELLEDLRKRRHVPGPRLAPLDTIALPHLPSVTVK